MTMILTPAALSARQHSTGPAASMAAAQQPVSLSLQWLVLTAQMYGKLDSDVKLLSRPSRMTLVYVKIHPMMIMLFK